MLSLSYLSKAITAILIGIPAFFMVFFEDLPTPSFLPVLLILVLAAPTLINFIESQNRYKALAVYLLFTIIAISIELIGVRTGFPYGNFHYSDLLPLKVAGEVPVTLSLTFVPLLIGAFAISQKISNNKLTRIILTTVFLLLADLVLDPGAVHVNLWTFEQNGFYYNVPFSNYLGWIFSGLIFSVLCAIFLNEVNFNYKKITFTYEATIWYWTIACLSAGLVIPVIVGLSLLIYLEFSRNSNLCVKF